MALTGAVAPYGLNQLKVVPAGGSLTSFPWGQTLKFSEEPSTNELKGDDKIVATVTVLEKIDWEIEAGGISLEAYAAITGRTLTNAGTGAAETQTMKASGADAYPYFKLYGKVITDEGDLHIKFFKAKLNKIEGEFKNGEFFVTKCEGTSIDDGTNGIMELVRNETATTLPLT
jgi:hypothetical protein